ncbi:MAG TPA: hypothetical protein VHZ09_19195 [Acidobacteriaceae bacterium]|jgi:uncharacterized zinc-type alcohol dehydrogenase-like protein|nr:hypothetical protein [Acidobacteriaceae bacterium]
MHNAKAWFAADHDVNAYINLLRSDGNLTLVGAGRRSLSGSPIGGIRCRSHSIQKVNEVYDRLLKSDVKYRFPIDMASLRSE